MAITVSTKNPTAYDINDLGDVKPEIVVGGLTDKFVPNANFSFPCFSGLEKYFFNINRASVKIADEKESLTDKLSLTVGSETDIWRIDDNGRLKWDIEFSEKPKSNILSWEIQYSEDLSLYRIGELSEEEKLFGCSRPDECIGSYVVYCDKSGSYKNSRGKIVENYLTGKLFTIYRPLCIDADGKSVWADLEISGNTLTITIPQDFINSCKYPLTLDPTFGYTSLGGSTWTTADYSFGYPVTAGSDGTLDNIYLGCASTSGADHYAKLALFSDSSGPDTLQGTQQVLTIPAGGGAAFRSVSYSASLSNGVDYWLCFNMEYSTFNQVYYDAVDVGEVRKSESYSSAITGGSYAAPGPNYKISIYGEYSTGGGTTAPPTTIAPTTVGPTTVAPTTVAPTTIAPTTIAPTTIVPTTLPPTTLPPTTLPPTTLPPTTLPPTTLSPTTVAPTTIAPTTVVPTTEPPTTPEPTTLPPTTLAPTTLPPTTIVPTTLAPTTAQPTVPPTTKVPTTPIPVTTLIPTTLPITTLIPTTVVPISTLAPTTIIPLTTVAPTTEVPLEVCEQRLNSKINKSLLLDSIIYEEADLNSKINKEILLDGDLCR